MKTNEERKTRSSTPAGSNGVPKPAPVRKKNAKRASCMSESSGALFLKSNAIMRRKYQRANETPKPTNTRLEAPPIMFESRMDAR